jgi:hypothetical protein
VLIGTPSLFWESVLGFLHIMVWSVGALPIEDSRGGCSWAVRGVHKPGYLVRDGHNRGHICFYVRA